MPIETPISFHEALQLRAIKKLLPTAASSAELEKLHPEITLRATFSARTNHLGHLARMDKILSASTGAMNGAPSALDPAAARLALKKSILSTGYDPEAEGITPGSLKDLSSDARLNLIINHNTTQAWAYGDHVQGMQPDVLDAFPAQELIRVETRKTEREWVNRWRAAGGHFPGGRMIALKTDPIWAQISRFKLPFPPFDFGSGMGLQDIDRTEAEALGLIKPGETLTPTPTNLNEAVSVPVPDVSPGLLESILQAFATTIVEGRITIT